MYCPRCGTPNEPGDRFCSACGATLSRSGDAEPQATSLRERLTGLIGTTRRARLISLATLIAVAVAVASFVALEPGDDGIPRDEYTLAAERICLDAKAQILAVGARFRARANSESTSDFARSLLPAVTSWRLQFGELDVPEDRTEEAARLAGALREVEARIAGLARVARSANSERTVTSAARADEASTAVEEAVSSLGLDECARFRLGVVPDES